MRRWLALLLLLASPAAFAQSPALVYCIYPGSPAPCLSDVEVGNGNQGMPAWMSFGVLNQDNLTSWATLQPPLNGVINTTGNTNTTNWGSTPLPAGLIPPTAVTPGSYGSGTQVPMYTVGADGRITAAANVAITGAAPSGAAGGALSGTYPNPGIGVGAVTDTESAIANKPSAFLVATSYVSSLSGLPTIDGVTMSRAGTVLLANQCQFTASISATVMTVSAVTGSCNLAANDSIVGAASGTSISSLGSGTGGTGTYNVSVSQTLSSTILSDPASPQNGFWCVPASGAWARCSWYPSGGTVQAMIDEATMIRGGNTYAAHLWKLSAPTTGTITIDTTPVSWTIAQIALNASTMANLLALTQIGHINPGDVLCNSGTAAASPADCPTSSTRYSSASPITIGSGDNGGIIVQNFNGNWSTVLAQSGTTGFPAGSFSVIIYNAQGGIGTITPTTSTINGAATVYMPPYSAALLTADNTSSPGNYNFISLGFLNDGTAGISLLGAGGTNTGILTYQGTTKYWGLYQGGATPPVFNLYDYYGSRYVFEANPNGALEVMPNGGLTEIGGGTESIGTTFTLGTGTGACATSSTLTGGAATGSFLCTGTAGASTQVINLPTAANGWWCTAFDTDTTTPTVLGQVGPIATTSCKVSGSISVTSDVITFHAEAY